jgi:hypothetical protein
MTMSVVPGARPVIQNPESDLVLVGEVPVGGTSPHAVAEAVVGHWQSAFWPAELCSLTVFTSSDGTSVLTYAQWSSEAALLRAVEQEGGICDVGAVVPGAPAPTPFRLYRVVRGGAIEDPAPVAESFPVAFFGAENHQAARAWIDGLLAAEEADEGDAREYPGGISANMHISLDGTAILSLSEWVSEAHAVAHIEAVWEPVLKELGGTGLLYRHFRTLLSAA